MLRSNFTGLKSLTKWIELPQSRGTNENVDDAGQRRILPDVLRLRVSAQLPTARAIRLFCDYRGQYKIMNSSLKIESLLMLIGFISVCFLAAAMGAIFRPGAWYEQLAKPSWRPPNWLFAPVWTLIYLTIAVSGWLVWRKVGWAGGALPLAIYMVQLLLNAAWTPLFFGLHRPDLAFLDIVLLWLSIIATMVVFHPISQTAAFLLLPYLLWVTFAAALNFSIWQLNLGKIAG